MKETKGKDKNTFIKERERIGKWIKKEKEI